MGKFGRLVKRVTGIKKLGGGSRPTRDADSDDRERGGGVAASMPPRWDPPVSPPAPRGDAPAGASFSSEEASPPDARGDKLAALLRQGVRIDASPAKPLAAVSGTSPFPAAPGPFPSPGAAAAATAPGDAPGPRETLAGSPFGSPAARALPFTPTRAATAREPSPFVADASLANAGAETHSPHGQSPPSSPFASPFASPRSPFASRCRRRRNAVGSRRPSRTSRAKTSRDIRSDHPRTLPSTLQVKPV